jgi:hypothetical protein
MALIELKSNLSKKVGETNTTENGTFRVNQGDNTERDTSFTDNQVSQQYDKLSPDEGQLIKRKIGKNYRGTNLDGGLTRGGKILNIDRQVEDTKRITKYLATPKGVLFKIKQNILQKKNARPETRNYDGTSVIRNIDSVSEILDGDRSQAGSPRHRGGGKYSDSSKNFRGQVTPAVTYLSNTTNVAGEPKKLQVKYGPEDGSGFGNLSKFEGQGSAESLPEDFIKFRIRDAVNGRWIIFPALVTGITDNSSATYSKTNYIGRPDAVHVYQNRTRSISFNLKALATNRTELPIMWKKVDALKGLTQPSFKPFFFSTAAGKNQQETKTTAEEFTRPTAPYVYLTIGDMFINTPGYFESVNVTIPESTSWETLNNEQFPHMCDIACTFTYIGRDLPTTLSPNYDGNRPGLGFNTAKVTPTNDTPTPAETPTDATELSGRERRRARRTARRNARIDRRIERNNSRIERLENRRT